MMVIMMVMMIWMMVQVKVMVDNISGRGLDIPLLGLREGVREAEYIRVEVCRSLPLEHHHSIGHAHFQSRPEPKNNRHCPPL